MRPKTHILLIIIFGILVYFNSLLNGFVGDDRDQILENPQVQSITNIPKFFSGSTYYSFQTDRLGGLYYRPVMMGFYSLIYGIFGQDPLFFHLFQVMLHIITAILLYLLFKHFVKNSIAFLSSLFFLVHPINTEAIVYIANLQEVLFLFFGLMALLIMIKRGELGSVFFLLLLSIFSKETGVLFIFILLLYSVLFAKRTVKPVLFGSAIVLFIYLIFRFGVANMQFAQIAIAPIAKAALPERLLNVPEIIFYYLKTFLFPKDLTVMQFWLIQSMSIKHFFIPLLFVTIFFLILIASVLWVYKYNKKYLKPCLFFFLWFVSGLILHLQIVPLDMTVAERWFYFPIIGLLGLLGIGFQILTMKKYKLQVLALSIVIVILVSLSLRTFIRNFDWKDTLTLYLHDIQIAKDKFHLENGIAAEFINQGKYQEAKPYVLSSTEAYPYFGNVNNLAAIYLSEGNTKKAKEYLEKALTLGDNYLVYQNYSNFLLVYDTPQKAKEFTKNALQKYPKSPILWLNLAKAESLLGKYQH